MNVKKYYFIFTIFRFLVGMSLFGCTFNANINSLNAAAPSSFLPTVELKITSIQPSMIEHLPGETILIRGEGFSSGSVVNISGTPCTTQLFISSQEIQCILPLLSVGLVDVSLTDNSNQIVEPEKVRVLPAKPAFTKQSSYVLVGKTLQLNLVGGFSAVNYEITGPPLGSSVNASSGAFTAGNSIGIVNVRATDSAGRSHDHTIHIINPVSANLKQWFQADRILVANGSSVAAWLDFDTGSGATLTAPIVNRPTFRTSGINQRPALEFDGIEDFMTGNFTGPQGNSARTLFFVYQPTRLPDKNNAPLSQILLSYGGSNAFGDAFMLYVSSTNDYYSYLPAGQEFSNHGGWKTGNVAPKYAPMIGQLNWNGTSLQFRINGQEQLDSPFTSTLTTTPQSFVLGNGCFGGVDTFYYQGLVSELMIYDSSLNAAETKNVECYLATKYQIPLSAEQTCSVAPLAWSAPPLLITAADTKTLQVNGGSPPYSFRIISGDGTITSSGVLTAGNTVSSAILVEAKDSAGTTVTTTVTISPILTPWAWFQAETLAAEYNNNENIASWTATNNPNLVLYSSMPTRTPLFKPNSIGSLPGVQFDGVDDVMNLNSTGKTIGAQPRSQFVVVSNMAAKDQAILSYGDDYYGNNGNQLELYASPLQFAFQRHGYADGGNYNYTTAGAHLLEFVYDGSNIQVYANGNLLTTGSGSLGTVIGHKVRIGNSVFYSATKYLQGQIHEIIMYTDAINASQRQQIETYLKNKYAIP